MTLLAQIDSLFRHSKKQSRWATIFAGLLVLSMAAESLEVAVLGKDSTDKREGIIPQDDRTAASSIAMMEVSWDFLTRLYRSKYGGREGKGMKFNPLAKIEARGSLPLLDQALAKDAMAVVDTHGG